MSKIFMWIGIIVVVLIVVGALASGGKKDEATKVESTNTSQTSTATNQTDQNFVIGDIVKKGEYAITATNPNPNFDSGNQFIKPKEGNKFISVDVTLENTTKTKQSISSLLNFYAKDSEGNKGGVTFAAPSSLDGEVLAGDKLKGSLVYEFAQTAKGIKLYFNPSVFSGESTVINLGF